MVEVWTALAALGGFGMFLLGVWKYVNPLEKKADKTDMDQIEKDLQELEDKIEATEAETEDLEEAMNTLKQTLLGSDSEIDDGVLIELKSRLEDVSKNIEEVQRRQQESELQLEEVKRAVEEQTDAELSKENESFYRGGNS